MQPTLTSTCSRRSCDRARTPSTRITVGPARFTTARSGCWSTTPTAGSNPMAANMSCRCSMAAPSRRRQDAPSSRTSRPTTATSCSRTNSTSWAPAPSIGCSASARPVSRCAHPSKGACARSTWRRSSKRTPAPSSSGSAARCSGPSGCPARSRSTTRSRPSASMSEASPCRWRPT